MVTIIRDAKFIKKGGKTGSPIRFRFASKWRVAHPKANEDLFMLYDAEGLFVCSVTTRLLRKARKEYRNAVTDKKGKSRKSHAQGLRGH